MANWWDASPLKADTEQKWWETAKLVQPPELPEEEPAPRFDVPRGLGVPEPRPIVTRASDTTDDARAERGFARSAYMDDGLTPNLPTNTPVRRAETSSVEPKDYTSRSALGVTWDAVKRGGLRTASSLPLGMATSDATALQDAARSDQDILWDTFKQFAGADVGRLRSLDVSTPEKAAQALSATGAPAQNVNTFRQIYDQRLTRANDARENRDVYLKRYLTNAEIGGGLLEKAYAIPMSESAERMKERLAQDETLSGTLSALVSNPLDALAFLGEVGVESAPAIAASIGAGVVARNPVVSGAVLGAGSAAQEFGASAYDVFQDAGLKIDSPETAKAALDNPALWAAAGKRGATRATVIALFEMMGQGVAAQQLMKSKVGDAIVQTLGQMGTGAGGEAAAMYASGEELKGGEILIEGLAEGLTAPFEVGSAAIAGRREASNDRNGGGGKDYSKSPLLTESDKNSAVPDDIIGHGKELMDEMINGRAPVAPNAGVAPLDEAAPNVITPTPEAVQRPLPTDRLSPSLGTPQEAGTLPQRPETPVAAQATVAATEQAYEDLPMFDGDDDTGKIVRKYDDGRVEILDPQANQEPAQVNYGDGQVNQEQQQAVNSPDFSKAPQRVLMLAREGDVFDVQLTPSEKKVMLDAGFLPDEEGKYPSIALEHEAQDRITSGQWDESISLYAQDEASLDDDVKAGRVWDSLSPERKEGELSVAFPEMSDGGLNAGGRRAWVDMPESRKAKLIGRLSPQTNQEQNAQTQEPVPQDQEPVAVSDVPAPFKSNVFLENEDLTSIEADPETFQYKSGGDNEGVTDRLLGVKRWETDRAGQAIVYEYADGRRVIADGHQRLGLAKRLSAEGQDVSMPVTIFREVDGYKPEDIMVRAALKNVAESDAKDPNPEAIIDAAKVLRARPNITPADMNLPNGEKSALGRNALSLRNLSDEAFGMLVNERASMRSAIAVANAVSDKAAQANILSVVEKSGARNKFEAEMVAKQAAADTVTQTQDSLFGSEDVTETLYLERARVMDQAIKRLRTEASAFKTILRNAGNIENVGENRVDRDASAQKASEDAAAQEYITRLANSKGPISDALTEAARSLKAGGNTGQAVTGFVQAVRSGLSEGSSGRQGSTDIGRNPEPARGEQEGQVDGSVGAGSAAPVGSQRSGAAAGSVGGVGAPDVARGIPQAGPDANQQDAIAGLAAGADSQGSDVPQVETIDGTTFVTGIPKAGRSRLGSVAPKAVWNEKRQAWRIPTAQADAARAAVNEKPQAQNTPAEGIRAAPATQARLDKPSSYVIRNKDTGEVVLETSDQAKIDALNTDKYEAVPVQQHLAELNKPNSKAAKAALKSPISRKALQTRDNRETVTPETDTVLGKNDAGETVYQREDGQIYRMREDRKDKPNGYPDFGGDLVVVDQPTDQTEAGTQNVIPGAEQSTQRSEKARDADRQREADVRRQQSKMRSGAPQDGPGGLFDTQGDMFKEQRQLDMFYSPLHRALSQAKQKQAPAKDWKAIIAKLPGVKAVEIEWLGINDWLDSQEGTQIPREAVMQFVADSQIQIVEDRQTEDGPERGEFSEYDAEEELGDDLIPEPDFRIETGEADWPDDSYFADNAEMYLDDAREELEDRLDEDESADDITDAEIQERAEEIARERYEPSNYSARLYNYEDDTLSGAPQEYEGYYDSETQEYFFPELSDDNLEEYEASTLAHAPIDKAREKQIADKIAEMTAERDARIAAESEGRDFTVTGQARFNSYTEDGGTNYREILLRVPDLHKTGKNAQGKSPFVQSAHFEQENIVVHARVKDRTGPNGERVLFVEEIQSDLASVWRENQEAPEVTARRAELRDRLGEASTQSVRAERELMRLLDEASDGYRISRNSLKGVIQEYAENTPPETDRVEGVTFRFANPVAVQSAAKQHLDLLRNVSQVRSDLLALGTEKSIPEGTPDTPFQQEHTYNLMVKRLLRMAAEEGYDQLSWTPGYMQAERWNSAAQSVVEGVRWGDATSETAMREGAVREVTVTMAGGEDVVAAVSNAGIISASARSDLEGKPLSALLGPKLAKQIMDEPTGSVSGQKITFPDSGYAIAYDQQTRKAVDKLVKKHGTSVRVDKSMPDFRRTPELKGRNPDGTGIFEEGEGNPVWSVNITPELREAAMRPMAMFRQPSAQDAATVEAAMPDLQKRLKQMMLGRVKLETAEGATFQGAFEARGDDLRILVGQTQDGMKTVNHEAVHALRNLNLFTDNEWDALTDRAVAEWLDKYDIANRYDDLNAEAQIEEAIAEAFADFVAEQTEPGPIKTAFAKMRRMFRALKEWVTGNPSVQGVFEAVDTGRVGGRQSSGGKDGRALQKQINTATAAFKRWFGDSKVVDDSGKPLVVYHGTGADFDAFSKSVEPKHIDLPGFFFTPSTDIAERFSESASRRPFRDSDGYIAGFDGSSIMPVHLSIQSPMEIELNDAETGRMTRSSEVKKMLQDAQKSGYDGAVIRGWADGSGETQFVAFRPEQIKSVYNRGTFDPDDARIMYQRQPSAKGRAALAQMNSAPHVPDRTIWEEAANQHANLLDRVSGTKAAAGDALDRFRVQAQDRMLPILRVEQAIETYNNATISKKESAYYAEERYAGRVGYRLEQFREQYSIPIARTIARAVKPIELTDPSGESRKGQDAANLFLYARHAKERNAYIASINDQMPDGGSGMTNAEADAILKQAAASPHAKRLNDIATHVDQLVQDMIDWRVDAGLMTAKDGLAWKTQYKHYIPLQGWVESENFDAFGSDSAIPKGRRFNVRGKEAQKALGRKTEAYNPLSTLLGQAEEVIVRAEKNRVAKALYDLAAKNPSPAIWEVKEPETRRVFNKATGRVETRVVGATQGQLQPNEFAVKINGTERRIVLHDPRLARALGQVGVNELDALSSKAAIFSRFFSAMNTMLSPPFLIVNAFRDMVTAQINLGQLPPSMRGKVRKAILPFVGNYGGALKGAWQGQAEGGGSSQMAQYFREFSESGAKVSFWQMENPEAQTKTLEKQIRLESGSKAARTAKKLLNPNVRDNAALKWVERANLSVDNAVRLAAFVEARNQGWTIEEAASLSKNLTVNFNRRGELGATVNAWFPFANAAIQGSHVIAKAAKSRQVQGIIGGAILHGIAMEFLNAAMSEEDDDGELVHDKIPNYISERNLIIPTGGKARATMPLPYGYNVPFYMGQQIAKVLRGVKPADEAALDVMKATFGAFSPLNGEDLQSTVSPLVLDFANELASNEDWLGRPIRPESAYADYGPQSYKVYNAPDWMQAVMQGLNSATGGSEYEKGLVDISPEYLQHTLQFLGGGAGRFAGQVIEGAQNIATGQEIESHRIPIVKVVRYEPGDWLEQGRYFDFREKVNNASAMLKAAKENNDSIDGNLFEQSKLYEKLKFTERQRKKVSEKIESVWADTSLSKREQRDKLKPLYDARTRIYLDFNKAYISRMGPQSE